MVDWSGATRLPSAGLPAIDPCAFINVPQKNGISFSRRCLGRRCPVAFIERLVFRTLARLELRLHDRHIEPAEHLLDPGAVERHEDHGRRRLRGGGHVRIARQAAQQRTSWRTRVHERSDVIVTA